MKKYTLAFSRVLFQDEQFILETANKRYLLTTGISEYYILMNLTGESKKEGRMLIAIKEQEYNPVLLPIAILQNEQILWITVTEDENTDYPELAELSLPACFETDKGEMYPDGFIDSTRTTLPYKELMRFEKILHTADYVPDFYTIYSKKYPDCKYDVRLHYFMIKSIRKHRNYVDDFCLPCDAHTFYQEWSDPFPCYLYIKTFGGADTWPSYARMRLMAENRCIQGIPLAIKILKSGKANDRICHYALLIAGLDEVNDELVSSYTERCPRAVARVWYERKSSRLYPMILDNARRILAGSKDDILDDLAETYMPDHNKYSDYTIDHRGYINLETLTLEQVRELWEIYRQIAILLMKSKKEEERLRLGNAFRSFMMAVVYNPTIAVAEIMQEVYNNYNTLLYGKWSQDSHFGRMDSMWSNYLYQYALNNNLLDNFWIQLQQYAKNYDSYALYTNQYFFLRIYSKVAYHVLPPQIFYNAFSQVIDRDYVLVENIWSGVTSDMPLPENASYPPLDHRWQNMFLDYNYYTCSQEAYNYYELVKHKIQPHPENWDTGKWQRDLAKKKKTGIILPQ